MIGLYAFISFLIAAFLGAWYNFRARAAHALRRSKWLAVVKSMSDSDDLLSEQAFDAAIRAVDSNSADPILKDAPAGGIFAGKICLHAATVYRELLQETNAGGRNLFKAGRARILDDDLAGLLSSVAKDEEPSEIQVVSLSLGLCTRANRLKRGWRPQSSSQVGLVWFEVEPAAAAERRTAQGLQSPPDRMETKSVSISLETCSASELIDGLKGAGFSSLAPSVFVVEGILSSWSLDRAMTFLKAMSRAAGPGSKILATLSSDEVVRKDPRVLIGTGSLMEVGRIEATGWGRVKLSADVTEVVRARYRRELMPRYPLFSSPTELSQVAEVEQVLRGSKL